MRASPFRLAVTMPSIFSGLTLKSKMDLCVPYVHYQTSTLLNVPPSFGLFELNS